jgi:HlyD family secretion protein
MKTLNVTLCALLLGALSPTLSAQDAVATIADQDPVVQETMVGKIAPMEGKQVVLDWARWNGQITFIDAALHGSRIEEGNVIARFDASGLEERLHDVTRRLHATGMRNELAKVRADMAQEAAHRRLRDAEIALEDAHKAQQNWEEFELNYQRKSAELSAQRSKAGLEDSEDELEQLKAMYTEDELTDATEEIVLKRSIRNLEAQRFSASLSSAMREFTAKVRWPITSRDRRLAVERADIALNNLRTSIELDAVERNLAANDRDEAMAKLSIEVDELTADLAAFVVRAPATGILVHGGLRQYQAGQKPPRFTDYSDGYTKRGLFTVYQPEDQGVILQIPEDKFGAIDFNAPVTATAVALPDVSTTGTLHVVPPQATVYADVAPNIILCWVKLDEPLTMLLPGRSVSVSYTVK